MVIPLLLPGNQTKAFNVLLPQNWWPDQKAKQHYGGLSPYFYQSQIKPLKLLLSRLTVVAGIQKGNFFSKFAKKTDPMNRFR